MTDIVTCTRCGKPIERETLQKGDRCPHCGEAAFSPSEHGPERGDPGGTSTTVSSRHDRLARIARLLKRTGLLLSVGVIASAVFGESNSWIGLLLILLLAVFFAGFLLALVGHIIKCVRQYSPKDRLFLHLVRDILVSLLLLILGLGFLTPLMFRYIRRSPETIAIGYCRNTSEGLLLFHKDTDTWPIYTSADRNPDSRVDYLYGNMGNMPDFTKEASKSWGTRSEDTYFILVTNGRSAPWYRYGSKVTGEYTWRSRPSAGGWAEPYLPYVTDDPWGFAYLISVSGFEGGTKPDNHVWCLSAGPNRIVDTPAWATVTRGDDIGYRYK